MSDEHNEAAEVYPARLAFWQQQTELLQREFRTIGNWRLVVAIIAIAIAFFSLRWLPLPILLFLALMVWHSKVKHRQQHASRGVRFYEAALRRRRGEWPGTGQNGSNYLPDNHVYGADLDLFGHGSLFQLLSQARTEAGQAMLAQWLLAPAPRPAAQARQQAALDLQPRWQLREDLSLLGEEIAVTAKLAGIEAWANRGPVHFSSVWRLLLPVLALANVAALLAFFGLRFPLAGLLTLLAVTGAIHYALRASTNRATADTGALGTGLRVLQDLMRRLEQEQFTAPRLVELQASLQTSARHHSQTHGSQTLGRLQRLVDWQGSSEHMLFKALRFLLLLGPQVAIAFEDWRQKYGKHLALWLRGLAELEAACSFGAFAYENPNAVFPELLESSEPVFASTGLRHPLLPPDQAVPNHVRLGPDCRLLIVSGSNMSGKSTLLRAIGLNTVIAWAGGPVTAANLSLSRLQTGASIRVVDSTLDHRSRFMAEILRLQQIVGLQQQTVPLLFLLDEILSGTNSHDRRIGAQGILHKLLSLPGIGLVTTHDLALTELAPLLQAQNVHLDDELVDGALRFDYVLKPGVVARSNALDLMRSIGLTV